MKTLATVAILMTLSLPGFAAEEAIPATALPGLSQIKPSEVKPTRRADNGCSSANDKLIPNLSAPETCSADFKATEAQAKTSSSNSRED